MGQCSSIPKCAHDMNTFFWVISLCKTTTESTSLKFIMEENRKCAPANCQMMIIILIVVCARCLFTKPLKSMIPNGRMKQYKLVHIKQRSRWSNEFQTSQHKEIGREKQRTKTAYLKYIRVSVLKKTTEWKKKWNLNIAMAANKNTH